MGVGCVSLAVRVGRDRSDMGNAPFKDSKVQGVKDNPKQTNKGALLLL